MLTITARIGDYYGDGSSNHIWATRDSDGALIAELYVSTDRREIMNIWVDEDHRGEGHARQLYETATDQMDVFHAPVAHRTPEGNAFAEAVGGETVTPYPCDCYACDTMED
ncbi:GNAT family N-acetyltransferase [Streptomyces huasconensis]|uniref:GNAT family N-acetyltransferase n=1 Tax=Streptomyces huasconensis TaxID=1854574 RepID=UPI0036F97D10